jgi:hypothetical protein
MAPDLELIKACFDRLRADAAVTALIPATAIYDRVPETADGQPDVPSPYIATDYTSILPDDADCIPGVEIEFQMDAYSWGTGEAYSSAQVRKIADAVRVCLHEAEFSLTVNALATIQHTLTRVQRASDGITNHAAIRFVAVVETH